MKIDPLEGRVFGQVKVVARAADCPRGNARYFLRCSCGTELLKLRHEITNPRRPLKNCGCARRRRWTPEDFAFLYSEYPKRGWIIANDMGRSVYAVRKKADDLGIIFKVPRRPTEWTEEEDAIIRQHYPSSGAVGAIVFLPKRSKLAIRGRAHWMGIKCPDENRYRTWKPHEEALIHSLYLSHGWHAVHTKLPNRSRIAIMRRAVELGYYQPVVWSDEETALLREAYPRGGIIASRQALPGHSDNSIRSKVRKLGLRFVLS